jgi:hypothetical protein
MQITKQALTSLFLGSIVFCAIFTGVYLYLSQPTENPVFVASSEGAKLGGLMAQIGIAGIFASLSAYATTKIALKHLSNKTLKQ